jgi:hypothetical protein
MSLSTKVATGTGALSLMLMLLLVVAGDLRPLKEIKQTDYVTALYVAGHMVAHNVGGDLYPVATAKTFYDEKFADYARRLLAGDEGKDNQPEHGSGGTTDRSTQVSAGSGSSQVSAGTGQTTGHGRGLFLFTYPPPLAIACAPLALLSPVASLAVWQAISLLALFLSALLFATVGGVKRNFLAIFVTAFLFFPLLNVFVTGQTSIVLGLAPLVAGYCFWQKQRSILAGLSWSVLALKPQLMIPVFAIVVALFICSLVGRGFESKKEVWSMIAGVALGLLLFAILSVVFLGFDSLPNWLKALQLSSHTFAASETGYWQYHLFFSAPCLLVVSLPPALWVAARTPAYVGGVVLLAAGIAMLCRASELKLERSRKIDLMIVLAMPLMVMSAPHLLIYDLSMFLLPAWIIFFRWQPDFGLTGAARRGLIVLLAGIDLYFAFILSGHGHPPLVCQLLLVFVLTLYTVFLFVRSCWTSGDHERISVETT